MKVDKQRRLVIPKYFIDKYNMCIGSYYLCDENGKMYLTKEITNESKVLTSIIMEGRNRIVIPQYLKCYVDTSKEITVYEQNNKIWIENYKKLAE